MTPRVWIKKVTFKDGTELELEKDEILLFVGANNVGKSASLNEIHKEVNKNSFNENVLITSIELGKDGDETDLVNLVERLTMEKNSDMIYRGFGFAMAKVDVPKTWISFPNQILNLSKFFACYLNTITRLSLVDPPKNISLNSEPNQHPIHFLQRDDKLEKIFSDYFNQAFGKDVIINRGAGSIVPIHVGIRPVPRKGEDRVSKGYLDELEKLPFIHEQGDGMKSFLGIILNVFISHFSMVFIDEPEAFLHPPQARLLGKMIGKELPNDRQLFLATHSGDFLRGLLDSSSKKVRVVRLDRVGDQTKICELKNEEINNLWADSLLRHSNVLDGIFHKKVVLCESDSDCRFYSAILGAVLELKRIPDPGFMFIHCGGKHRLPKVTKALRSLNIELVVIGDFDILNNENPLKDVVSNLGGNWDLIKDRWKMIKNSIDSKRPLLKTSDVKEQIGQILNNVEEENFPKDKSKEIKEILKKISAWSSAKKVGEAFIPSGDSTLKYNEIKRELNNINLFIPECGELEGFCRSIGNHGPKWIIKVLEEKDLKNDPELEPARRFMLQILDNGVGGSEKG